MSAARPITRDDVLSREDYAKQRAERRKAIIELKRRRRVALGTLITVVFEHRATIRFQVQEMARAEGLTTDDAIQAELDVYNPMIPEPGTMALLGTGLMSMVAAGGLRRRRAS